MRTDPSQNYYPEDFVHIPKESKAQTLFFFFQGQLPLYSGFTKLRDNLSVCEHAQAKLRSDNARPIPDNWD